MTSESVGLFSGYFKNHVNISIHSSIFFYSKIGDGLVVKGVYNCALGSPGILLLNDEA